MNEKKDSVAVTQIKRHQFTSLLVGSIGIALFFVFVALSLYQSSGTLQLDLSRPGYDVAREEATKDSQVYTGFSPDGVINNEALGQFETLYADKAKEASTINAFSGDALSSATLRLDKTD